MAIKGLIGVIGGNGFVGSELCAQLICAGYSVRLLTRNVSKCRHLKVLPSLSIIQIKDYSAETLTSALKDCHALFNLIGILNEKGRDGKEFHRIHVGITRAALNACESAKIPRLLQMSALNADADGPSHYLRSKGKAENYLKTFSESQVDYTIFKPSVIFGEGDSFLNRFAGLLKTIPGVFPLACANARFAPVYVGDVAKKMTAAIDDISAYNQSYELCGPNIYTLKELVQYTSNICGYKRTIIGLPLFLSKLQATVFEYVPGKPFSKDNFNSLKLDSVCNHCVPCTTSLAAIAPTYLTNK
jgi:uncharacterized protein YbjT (DUF2867 family)